MTTLAGILVLVGIVIMLLATELIDDLFIAGLIFSRFRRRAPTWMRRSVVALCIGITFIVAGIALLHFGS